MIDDGEETGIPTLEKITAYSCLDILRWQIHAYYSAERMFQLRHFVSELLRLNVINGLRHNLSVVKEDTERTRIARYCQVPGTRPNEQFFFENHLIFGIAEIIQTMPLLETTVFSDVKEELENKLIDVYINAMDIFTYDVNRCFELFNKRLDTSFFNRIIESTKPEMLTKFKIKLNTHSQQIRIANPCLKFHECCDEDDPAVIDNITIPYLMSVYYLSNEYVHGVQHLYCAVEEKYGHRFI